MTWLEVADVGCPRNGSVLRIYRFAVWRWVWIWGRYIIPPRIERPQSDNAAWEIGYMREHPELWPPSEDYAAVYAEHHYASADFNIYHDENYMKVEKDAEADHGSAG